MVSDMYTSTALITVLSLVLGYIPRVDNRVPNPATIATNDYEVLERDSYTDDDGRQITYVVWTKGGEVEAELSISIPHQEIHSRCGSQTRPF